MFDEVVAQCLPCEGVENEDDDKDNDKTVDKLPDSETMLSENDRCALDFIDSYFTTTKVEFASDAANPMANVRVMRYCVILLLQFVSYFYKLNRYTWTKLYQIYEADTKFLKFSAPIDYDRFCAVRKKFRPSYRRSRKSKNSRWKHLECPDCTYLESCIDKAKVIIIIPVI